MDICIMHTDDYDAMQRVLDEEGHTVSSFADLDDAPEEAVIKRSGGDLVLECGDSHMTLPSGYVAAAYFAAGYLDGYEAAQNE